MYERLKMFLEDSHDWEAFQRNFEPLPAYPDIESFANSADPSLMVSAAFDWANSPEGPIYWMKVHEAWKNEIL